MITAETAALLTTVHTNSLWGLLRGMPTTTEGPCWSQALRKMEKDETQLSLSHSSFAMRCGPWPGSNFPKGDASCIEMDGVGSQLSTRGESQKVLLEHGLERRQLRHVKRSGMDI